LADFFQGINAFFETVSLKEESVFVYGNRAAVKWIGSGISKNERSVTFEGIDVFEVNEAGKIQTAWGYWEPSVLMAQLQE